MSWERLLDQLRSNARVISVIVIATYLSWQFLNAITRPSYSSNVNAQNASTLTRFITMDIVGMYTEGKVVRGTLGGGGAMMYFEDIGTPFLRTNFILPPDFAPSSIISIRLLYELYPFTSGSECFFYLGPTDSYSGENSAAFGVDRTIDLKQRFSDGSEFKGFSSVNYTGIDEELITLQPSDSSEKLLPGDAVTFSFARHSTSANDTCDGIVYIYGLIALYQSPTTYLPIIVR